MPANSFPEHDGRGKVRDKDKRSPISKPYRRVSSPELARLTPSHKRGPSVVFWGASRWLIRGLEQPRTEVLECLFYLSATRLTALSVPMIFLNSP